MFNLFLFPLVIMVRAYIYPSAIQRVSDDLLALGDELFYEVINWGKRVL